MAFVLVPAAIWAVGSARGDLRRLAPAAAVGFAIGALPVWLWAVKNGHIPTPLDAPITEASTLFQRSDNLTDAMVPMLFGVKLTDGAPVAGWLPSSLVVWALVAAFGVGLWKRRLGLWALARGSRTRREPIDLLLLVFVALPVFWLASRFAFFAGEPRYLQPIAPMISIGLAALVPRETRTAAIAVGATLLAALALVTGLAVNKVFALPDQVGGVAERCLPQVVSALQGKGVRSAYADYWVAYPLQWEADRKLTFAPTYASRFPDLTAQVDADPHAAYVAPVGPVADKIAAALKARHAKATRSDTCSVALFTGFRHTPKPPELGLP